MPAPKLRHTPITSPKYTPPAQFDFYRGPLFRTMSGYKLLSGTFILCGCVAVPALLTTGDQGIPGAIAVTLASILPVTLQSILVPGYVARMAIHKEKGQSVIDVMESLKADTKIQVSYFTLPGPIRTKTESLGSLRSIKSWKWANCYSKETGKRYYIEQHDPSPLLRKMNKFIETIP